VAFALDDEVASPTTGTRQSRAKTARDSILSMIAEGKLQLGDQLPTEAALAELFATSRSTIREAMKLLEQEGLVSAVQGKGRFLSALASLNVERPVTKYESTTEMLESLGYDVTNVVLAVHEEPADAVTAEALILPEGAPVIKLVRLRCGNDEPLVFSVNYIPREALPGPIAYRDWSVSITSALEGHGIQVASSIARIFAVDLPDDEARRYSLTEFGPWLLVEERAITVHGERVLYSKDYHRGDKIAFNVLRRR
jgi:GntR family transcriptional regulator